MGKPAVSLRKKLFALFAAGLIACGFMPFASALADAQDDFVAASLVGAESEGSGDAERSVASPFRGEAATPNPILASTLTSDGTSVISADVMLDASEPVIGSFTVDGLTFAVNTDGGATLVSVGASFVLAQSERSGEAATPNSVILSEGTEGAEVEGSLNFPSDVVYNGTTYPITVIGPYAFYLSGVKQVELPASITLVDDRAFRSSDVEWVSVDADNLNLTSFDGVLYSADLTSLLLIPEGRVGAVLLPCETEVVEPSKFSHCSLVEAIDVEEGGAAFASWDGLLYDAFGTTLLRVPAGATEITIREGCTTIAAGAMEGCVKLERINAPASVTFISPNVFESVPTVSLPAFTILGEGEGRSDEAATEEPPQQLTAMVMLSVANDDLPESKLSSTKVKLSEEADQEAWRSAGFTIVSGEDSEEVGPMVNALSQAETKAATYYTVVVHSNGHALKWDYSSYNLNTQSTQCVFNSGTLGVSDNMSVSGVTQWLVVVSAMNLDFGDRNTAGVAGCYDFYRFTSGTPGWSLNSFSYSAGGSPINTTSTAVWPNRNATVYALWRANTYTVSFSANGGSGGQSANVTATYDSAMPTISTTKPTRAGYTFGGYYDTSASTGGTQYYTAACASARTWNKTAATTLYARWSANTITCTWNSQGGSSIGNTSSTYSSTAKVPMPSSNPTKSGYTFAGWWTSASGGTQVTSSTTLPTSNPTYHAHWSTNPYTISYELNGGSVSGNPTTYNIETTTFTLKNPTKAGYAFAGWSGTGLTGSANTSVQVTQGSTGNRSYTANWTKNAVRTITLNPNGGSGGTGVAYQWTGKGWYETSNPGDATEAMAAIVAPTRAGFTFCGYATGSSAVTASYWTNASGTAAALSTFPGNSAFSANATLYAVWAGNAIACTWDSQGGSSIAATSATYSTSAKVPMPAADPTKQGYAFTGWWTEPDGGDKVTSEMGLPAKNTAYYAHWVPALSADVPLEVTARVDLLGIDEQTEASGYLESRSAGALEVAAIDFTPLAGATELFESNVSNVFLEALAEGTTDANVSFALSAAATETDADALAAFALPDGYGSRVGVAYRFAIPDDVLATIDQARFSEVTTPVGQVVYTVKLA